MSKRYHLTPKGPGICTAKLSESPYAAADHFDTTGPSFQTDYTNFNNKRIREKYQQLVDLYLGPNAWKSSITKIIEKGDPFGNRHLANDVEAQGDNPLYFMNIKRTLPFYLKSDVETDPNNQVTVQVERFFVASEASRTVKPRWRITIQDPTNKYKPTQTLEVEFPDMNTTHISKLKINEFAWLASSKNFHDEYLLNQNQEYMSRKIMETIISVENENQSEVELKKIGLSFFKDDDPLKVVSNNHFDTTFRARFLKRRLNTGSFFGNKPELKIRIYENEPTCSANWWAIKREGDDFFVTTFTEKDGKIEKIANDPKEARVLVENYISNNMRINSPQATKERGDFVEKFVKEVTEVVLKHNETLLSQTTNSSGDNLSGRKSEEEKGTIIGRLFKLLG